MQVDLKILQRKYHWVLISFTGTMTQKDLKAVEAFRKYVTDAKVPKEVDQLISKHIGTENEDVSV